MSIRLDAIVTVLLLVGCSTAPPPVLTILEPAEGTVFTQLTARRSIPVTVQVANPPEVAILEILVDDRLVERHELRPVIEGSTEVQRTFDLTIPTLATRGNATLVATLDDPPTESAPRLLRFLPPACDVDAFTLLEPEDTVFDPIEDIDDEPCGEAFSFPDLVVAVAEGYDAPTTLVLGGDAVAEVEVTDGVLVFAGLQQSGRFGQFSPASRLVMRPRSAFDGCDEINLGGLRIEGCNIIQPQEVACEITAPERVTPVGAARPEVVVECLPRLEGSRLLLEVDGVPSGEATVTAGRATFPRDGVLFPTEGAAVLEVLADEGDLAVLVGTGIFVRR